MVEGKAHRLLPHLVAEQHPQSGNLPISIKQHNASCLPLTGVIALGDWHPVLAARRVTGLTLRDLGLGLGAWRVGLAWLAVGVPLAILAGRIAALAPAMRAVYPLDPTLTADPRVFARYAALQFLYFGSWEVLFRGVLLFGLRAPFGAASSNVVQTALSVTAHFGRALNETLAAVPAGVVFGAIDLRVGSIWYVALLHWIVGVTMDWFILTT